jgi:hypothetical protein
MSPLTAAETQAVLACMPNPPVTEDELSAVEKLRATLGQTPSGEEGEPDWQYEHHMEQCAHGGTLMRIDRLTDALREINGHIGAEPANATERCIREVCEREFARQDAAEAERIRMEHAATQPSGEEGEGEAPEVAILYRLSAKFDGLRTRALDQEDKFRRERPEYPTWAAGEAGAAEAFEEARDIVRELIATHPHDQEDA